MPATLVKTFATTVSATHTDTGSGTHGDAILDVGETSTYSATHTVTQAEINAGTLFTNIAAATTIHTPSLHDALPISVIQNPNFTIAKIVTSVTGGAGAGNLSVDNAGD